jgi:hypothetical protein
MPPYVTIENMFDQLPRLIRVRANGEVVGVIDFSIKGTLDDGPEERWIEGHFRPLKQPVQQLEPVDI